MASGEVIFTALFLIVGISASNHRLRRLSGIVDQGEDYFLGEVSEADIESSTKYELFESIHTAWQALHAFRNSSLFEAADVAYSKGAYTYDVCGGWGEGVPKRQMK